MICMPICTDLNAMAVHLHLRVAPTFSLSGMSEPFDLESSDRPRPVSPVSCYQVVLQVPNEAQLLKTATSLESAGIAHKVWMEQPEAIPTCIATTPQLKSIVGSALKRLPLCKRPLYMSRGRGDGGEL